MRILQQSKGMSAEYTNIEIQNKTNQTGIVQESESRLGIPTYIGVVLGAVALMVVLSIVFAVKRLRQILEQRRSNQLNVGISQSQQIINGDTNTNHSSFPTSRIHNNSYIIELPVEVYRKQQMERVEKFATLQKYCEIKDNIYKINSCMICLIDFENEDEVRMTQCRHLLHSDCLMSWSERLVSHNPIPNSSTSHQDYVGIPTCPFCKRDLTTKLNQKEIDILRKHHELSEIEIDQVCDQSVIDQEEAVQKNINQSIHPQRTILERERSAVHFSTIQIDIQNNPIIVHAQQNQAISQNQIPMNCVLPLNFASNRIVAI
eukprot:403372478